MPVVTVGTHNYVVKVDGVDPKYMHRPFGRQLEDQAKIKAFKEKAKSYHVGAKRKATKAAVNAWLREVKPSQVYAKWMADSPNYKDDSVEVWYLD